MGPWRHMALDGARAPCQASNRTTCQLSLMSLVVRTRLEPLSAKRLKFTLELVDDDTPWQRDSVECLRRALLKLPCATLSRADARQ